MLMHFILVKNHKYY
jgi:hypothetical protein